MLSSLAPHLSSLGEEVARARLRQQVDTLDSVDSVDSVETMDSVQDLGNQGKVTNQQVWSFRFNEQSVFDLLFLLGYQGDEASRQLFTIFIQLTKSSCLIIQINVWIALINSVYKKGNDPSSLSIFGLYQSSNTNKGAIPTQNYKQKQVLENPAYARQRIS